MGWNGSGGVSTPVKPKVSAKKPSPVRGIVAGVLVCVLAIGAYFAFFSGSEKPQKTTPEKERGKIKEVKPTLPKPIVPKPGMVLSTNRNGKVYEHPPTNQWGNPWHWGPKKLRPAHTSRIDRTSWPLEDRLFKNPIDRDIANMLAIEPGTFLVGDDKLSYRWKERFLESLNKPVETIEDDSDEAKELKAAVLQARAELKARHEAGEDIEKIMTDTRRELRELGAYKDELKQQILKYRFGKEATKEGMQDIVDAANLMLEERGIPKLSMPEFFIQGLEYREKMRKAKENANQNK